MRDFTVIIPTWNQGRYLQALFQSIINSPFAAIVEEIIFVCDHSTDGSEEIIAKLKAGQGDRLPRVTLIQPPERRGLFIARYLGAKAAKTSRIMYIDSRITLPPESAKALLGLTSKYPAMVANVEIDIGKNIYCLYWERSHNIFYRRNKDVRHSVVTIDPQNFPTIRIGGTCFYCSRDLFVRLSESHLARPLLSDDTALFEDMLKVEHMVMHPDFYIQWEPRDSAKVFLKHLYGRGPGFAEFHLFRKKSKLFGAVVAGALITLTILIALAVDPLVGVSLALVCVLVLMLSTAVIARGLGEFFRLAPLHTAVILAYGFGALRGAWIVWRRNRAHAHLL